MPAVEFQPHQKQWDFIQDPADIVLAVAGKRGGKTCAAAIKFIQDITDNLKAGVEGDYLIVGPTYNLLRNGTVPTLMKYWPRKLGTYRRSESRIKLPNGKNGEEHYVFILSADEPDRIEAFGVLEAWLDEAGQYRQEVWDKVQQRLTTLPGHGSGRVIFSTSPYGAVTSWLNQDLILRAKNMPWVKVHRWSTFDNPFIDHTVANRFRESGNSQIFQRDFMGEYTQIEGLIYPDFSRLSEDYVVKPFDVPANWPLFAGIDYGFTDPTVILILAKDPEAKVFYIIGEYYKDGKSIHGEEGQLKDWQKFLQQPWGSKIKQLLYDPSAVGIMTLLKQVSRMNLVEAEGGPGSVAAGINRVTWLIKKRRLKFFNTCEKTIEDMEAYVYATTGKRDGKPGHDNSHGPDALRYAFSKDLLGIFPELKRPDSLEEYRKCFNEKGEYIPPERTISQIFDLKKDKDKMKKVKTAIEKEPGDCFEYAPKYDPWKEDE
jgi:PBSX family phage terminase large subunit